MLILTSFCHSKSTFLTSTRCLSTPVALLCMVKTSEEYQERERSLKGLLFFYLKISYREQTNLRDL